MSLNIFYITFKSSLTMQRPVYSEICDLRLSTFHHFSKRLDFATVGINSPCWYKYRSSFNPEAMYFFYVPMILISIFTNIFFQMWKIWNED